MAKFPSKLISLSFFIIILAFTPRASAVTNGSETTSPPPQCGSETARVCRNNAEALKLKIIAIAAILVTSMIGVCLPMFSRAVPALQPDKDLFVLVKAFASGVILATGYMHVLPDSFDCLRSDCLPEKPWKKFPFTTFVAMLSAVFTLMVDSYAMSYYRKRDLDIEVKRTSDANAIVDGKLESQHCHGFNVAKADDNASQLLRYRVVAQVLELGIVVHSVVIGLSMGASDNPCTIRPLVAALCFHQLFEGMGLGGCILQAEYGMRMKAVMVFLLLGDNSVRDRTGDRIVERVQRQQSDGPDCGRVAECMFGWTTELHGVGGPVGSGFHGPKVAKQYEASNMGLYSSCVGCWRDGPNG
ncbi:UNVERIFIED_CONTAM: Fe(2+) transport protein 2 [Sesamum latifolium]|uniref:Fe(2+) transport protein 2 n=1 Tax=Sesamum latifolium TaxID=2727402 RepID=A0AAW2WKH6_9LAMI